MNRGALLTRKRILEMGISQNAAARMVECDSGNFSKILAASGEKKPGRVLAAAIFDAFGTPFRAWDEEASEEELASLGDETQAEGSAA